MASPANRAVTHAGLSTQRPPPAPDLGSPIPVLTNGTANGAGKPSFASILSRPKLKSRFPELQLGARQYGTKDGVPSISFTAAEYQAATQRFAHTLIAKFQIGRPPFEVVKSTMLSAWNLEGRITIASNWDDRHIIIILDSEKDVNGVLTSPLRKVGHTMFRLFRWTADYNPKKESPTVTKWIRFPGLPMEMFDRAILKSIVSSFAMFLGCDEKTSELDSLTYARACVELDVTKSIPSNVWINLPTGKGYFQDIVIEGGIKYCSRCKIHGHDLTICRKVNKSGEKMEQGNTPKEGEVVVNQMKPSTNAGTDKKHDVQEWQIVNRRRKGGKRDLNEAKEDGQIVLNVAEPSNNSNNTLYSGGEGSLIAADANLPVQISEAILSPLEQSDLAMASVGQEDDPVDSVSAVDTYKELSMVAQGDQPLEQSNPAMASVGQEDDPVDSVSAVDTYKELSMVAQGDQPLELNFDGQASTAVVNKGLFHMVLDGNQVVHSQELDDYVKRAKENGKFEAFLKFCKENGYILPFGSSVPVEDFEKVDEDLKTTHNSNYEVCSQDDNTTRMPISTRTRNRKKSRSSTRSCPKQKDTNFVWS